MGSKLKVTIQYTVYRLTRMVKLMLYSAFLLGGMTYMVAGAGLPYGQYGKPYGGIRGQIWNNNKHLEITPEIIKEHTGYCAPFCKATGYRKDCQVCLKKPEDPYAIAYPKPNAHPGYTTCTLEYLPCEYFLYNRG